jgi:hypothetical protein
MGDCLRVNCIKRWAVSENQWCNVGGVGYVRRDSGVVIITGVNMHPGVHCSVGTGSHVAHMVMWLCFDIRIHVDTMLVLCYKAIQLLCPCFGLLCLSLSPSKWDWTATPVAILVMSWLWGNEGMPSALAQPSPEMIQSVIQGNTDIWCVLKQLHFVCYADCQQHSLNLLWLPIM